MNFYIPSYQRGYRWKRRQVKDLLNDVCEFVNKNRDNSCIYCMQPLVVKRRRDTNIMEQIRNSKNIKQVKELLKGQWEVIDGQQRLTTFFLILKYLRQSAYNLQYETRYKSEDYLKNIADQYTNNTGNIDYYYMGEAYKTIVEWFEEGPVGIEFISNCIDLVLQRVKFIWYEIDDTEDAKRVFARLNIGKIALTDAELIKALLLNKSNFKNNNSYKEEEIIQLYQREIAMQWDIIEYTLQSKELWLFLNNEGKECSTRIDLIFDIVAGKRLLGTTGVIEMASCEWCTFRYFYDYIENAKNKAAAIKSIWDKIMDLFFTLKEWFDDIELYHYVGFLICCNRSVSDILREWANLKTKESFKTEYLYPEIKRCLGKINLAETKFEGYGNGGPKTKCKPILLLHNIQTVINQNRVLANNNKYGQGVFYKFPFHLYKLEKWDIEHIDSNTTNKLNDIKSQREWLLNSFVGLDAESDFELKEEIRHFFIDYLVRPSEIDTEDKIARDQKFEKLKKKVEQYGKSGVEILSDEEKNMIWNFVLLDSSTNRSYGNSIFPAKRRVIMGKERGKYFIPPTLNEDGCLSDVKEMDSESSFIAPCTKYVFMKYYNTKTFSPNEWSKEDAFNYLKDIQLTLKDFL